MDAPNPSATPTFASRTPLHIGAVGLKVRDLDRAISFYRNVLGLAVLDRGKDATALGAGGVRFVHLEHRPNAEPDDPRSAGLYHTAFLMPTRGDLARWILHVARHKVPLSGASDHAVSEAFYLDDPEGNGVEVYCDRPADTWEWTGPDLKITTDPLDVESILQEVAPTATYAGAPDGLRIGHVHLRVGDVARAEAFYRDALGLDVTRRRRDEEHAGLSWLALEGADAAAFEAAKARLTQVGEEFAATPSGIATIDPWGTRLRITRA